VNRASDYSRGLSEKEGEMEDDIDEDIDENWSGSDW
jgi:hypothetical protein